MFCGHLKRISILLLGEVGLFVLIRSCWKVMLLNILCVLADFLSSCINVGRIVLKPPAITEDLWVSFQSYHLSLHIF